jgi:hypothetical protein
LHPAAAIPGEELLAEVRLESDRPRATTGIEVSLTGVERLNVPGPAPERTLFRLAASFPAEVLSSGERRYRVPFLIPKDAPPSFRGRMLRIHYEIRLRVGLSWWPDVDRRFDLVVRPRPRPHLEEPRIFTGALDPRSGDARAEATLASTELAPGEALIGAVSVLHAPKRSGALEVALVAREHVPDYGTTETVRYVARIAEGVVVGEAVRFGVRLPDGAPPTCSGSLGRCAWTAEISHVTAFSRDPLLAIPFEVTSRETGDSARAPSRVQLVGRSRRKDLWRRLASRAGLRFDEASDAIVVERRGVEAELAARDDIEGAPRIVAKLRFPRLGLELSLRERKWSDHLGPAAVPGLGANFDHRYVLHAREAELARAVLTEPVKRALLAVDGARLDEVDGELWLAGTGLDESTVRSLIEHCLVVVDELGTALVSMPLPRLAAPFAERWRGFASARGARFVRGEVAVEGLSLGEHRAGFGIVWEGPERIVGTRIRVEDALAASIIQSSGLASSRLDHRAVDVLAGAAESVEHRELLRELVVALSTHGELGLIAEALTLDVPSVLEDPSVAFELAERVAALAVAVRGRPTRSAYR